MIREEILVIIRSHRKKKKNVTRSRVLHDSLAKRWFGVQSLSLVRQQTIIITLIMGNGQILWYNKYQKTAFNTIICDWRRVVCE